MAVSEAAKEAIHLRALYNELAQCEAKPSRLHLHCKAAIDTAYNPEHHSKLKHVERRHFFIHQVVEDDKIAVPYVESDKNSRNSSPNHFPLANSSSCVRQS